MPKEYGIELQRMYSEIKQAVRLYNTFIEMHAYARRAASHPRVVQPESAGASGFVDDGRRPVLGARKFDDRERVREEAPQGADRSQRRKQLSERASYTAGTQKGVARPFPTGDRNHFWFSDFVTRFHAPDTIPP
jgi:hypothetical protein